MKSYGRDLLLWTWRQVLIGAVAILPALGIHAANVTLRWDANLETDLAGYNLYYGIASGTYTNMLNVGNVTNQTVLGLSNDVTYFFVVTAYNNDGLESNPSNEVAYTPGATNQVNQPPTLDPINDLTLDANAGVQSVLLTGISSGASNETEPVSVSASSSNPALIPDPTVLYISPNVTGLLTFKPVTNAAGVATISVAVNDGSTNVTRSFNVIVNPPGNTPPAITSIANQTIQKNTSTVPIPFTIADLQTPVQNLVLSGSSSNSTLVPSSQIVFGGIGAARTVTVTPARGKIGTTVITILVSDGTLQASTTFLLTVTGTGAGSVSAN